MSRKGFPSDNQDQFMVRMPDGMRERIARLAKSNGRSMNNEVIISLQNHLGAFGLTPHPLDAPDQARLDTFVAAALTGLIARGVEELRYEDALDIGKRMLDAMEEANVS